MPEWSDWIRQQLAPLKLAPTREAEIVEELAQHARDRYADLTSSGVEDAEARRITLDELSGHEFLARELQAVERTNAPGPVVLGAPGLWQDLRYGFRMLRNQPGFSAVAMLVLALGIGANTAVFSVVNGVLLRPLSYPDSSQLVSIYESNKDFSHSSVAYPNYLDWRREARSFASMGARRRDDFNFTGSGIPEQLSGEYVSASYFITLGVRSYIGRTFLPQEDRQSTACTVIVSYPFWNIRLGGDPNILQRSLTLNEMRCAVVGVLPREFSPGDRAQVFLPMEQYGSVELRRRQSHLGITVVGRLKPGLTAAAAQSEMAAVAAGLSRQYPDTNGGQGANVVPLKDDLIGHIQSTLWLLVGAVGFVLVIACANVANLLLARATGRKREFAIRAALGAERGRIIRQLLTESVLLAMGGAAIGLLLARWGTSLVLAAVPGSLPRAGEVSIDPYVLAFTLVVSILTGIVFGLAPAFLGANADPQEALKAGTRGAGGDRRRVESTFVAVEVGLAVILLAGAGLMLQSVWRLLQVNPGFNPRGILTAQVALSPKAMSNPEAIRMAYPQLIDRVDSIPGVQAAAITSLVPLGEGDSEMSIWPGSGAPPRQDQMLTVMCSIVTPDYLKAMQIPLLRGRFVTRQDTVGALNVVVIDDVMARHMFPDREAVGQQISLQALGPVRVVGVVGHVKYWGLDRDDIASLRDQMYFPLLQVPDQYVSQGVAGLTLMIRGTPEPLSLVSAVRAQVAGPMQDQPISAVRTMEQIISESVAERRFTMLVLAIFAVTALLLAAVGIYGVMSYSVTRRIHELGVRTALGASPGEIVGLVVRQGMTVAAIGMAAGLAAALALTRLMAKLLYGVQPADPATLATVTVLLGAIALLACYIPARRATTVDPLTALRWD